MRCEGGGLEEEFTGALNQSINQSINQMYGDGLAFASPSFLPDPSDINSVVCAVAA